jgi:hypothetical protein
LAARGAAIVGFSTDSVDCVCGGVGSTNGGWVGSTERARLLTAIEGLRASSKQT